MQLENNNGIETLNLKNIQDILKITDDLNLDGESFIKETYNKLDKNKQKDVYEAFINSKNNKNFIKYLKINDLPNLNDINDFLLKFGNESKVSSLIEEGIINNNSKEELEKQKRKLDKEESKLLEIEKKLAKEKENLTIEKTKESLFLLGCKEKFEIGNKYEEFFRDIKGKKFNNDEEKFQAYKEIIEKNWNKLLEKSKQYGKGEYEEIFSFLNKSNNSGLIKLEGFEKAQIEYETLKNTNPNGPKDVERIMSSIDTSKYEKFIVKDNKITYGDQIIDISTNPPKKFIKGENGFLLESIDVDFEINKETKKEMSETKNELENNNKKLELTNKKINDTNYYLNLLENDKKGISGLSELWGKEINGKLDKDKTLSVLKSLRDKYENNEQYKNTKILVEELILDIKTGNIDDEKLKNSQKLIEQTLKDENKKEIEKILKIKEDLLKQKEELEKSKKELESKLDGLNNKENDRKEKYKKSVLEKDQETRENLKKLEMVGLDFLGKDVLDFMVNRLNSDPTFRGGIDLGNGLRINTQLNFAEGKYGQPEGSKEGLKYLVRLANKLITGDPTQPNVVESIINGTISNFNKDKTKFIQILEDHGIKNKDKGIIEKNIIDNLELPIKTLSEKENSGEKSKNKENQPNPETNPEKK